jgi:D-apionolactonase
MTLPKNILYYGKEEALPERVPLRAGPLTMFYEAGDLRYIKLGDQEILRRIYVAVRDRNWGTVLPKISKVQMQIEPASFHITYEVENKEGDIHFIWQGDITGDAQGTVTFSMAGEARSTFLRNRIGFCSLHPIRECVGRPCLIERVDGPARHGAFPLYVAPEQPVEPFAELSALTYEVTPGVQAEIHFNGDVFEMEDQRNWTDASYKIFCTPLRLPYPVEVKEGTKISQSIELRLRQEAGDWVAPEPATATTSATVLNLQPDTVKGSLPRLGLGVASHGQALSQKALERLRLLRPDHLRVDLRLYQPDYETALRRAWAEAGALGIPLEVALFVSDAAAEELKALVTVLEEIKPQVWAWSIFHHKEKSTGETWANSPVNS